MSNIKTKETKADIINDIKHKVAKLHPIVKSEFYKTLNKSNKSQLLRIRKGCKVLERGNLIKTGL